MRTRATTVQRPVDITRDGRTHTVTETVTVQVPVPPVDWDRIIRGAVITGTLLFVVVSMAWTTASAGDLLARAVTPVIAYTAALGFDLAWIVCLGLEWLARYDRRRSRAARLAGWAFLTLAVGVVATHGAVVASWPTAVAGASVSVIAKGLWMLTMGQFARRLDPLTEQWLQREQNGIAAELALIGQTRALNRARGQVAAEAHALGLEKARAVTSADSPDPLSGQERTAVREALALMPDASVEEVQDQLRRVGFQLSAEDIRTLSGHLPDSTNSRPAPGAAQGGQSITDTVRTVTGTGITDPGLVLEGVRAVHGPDVRADTVERIRRDVLRGIR